MYSLYPKGREATSIIFDLRVEVHEYWEDWFWDMLIENLDEVLTEENAELVLSAMLNDCENDEAIKAVQEWIDANL